MRRGLWCLVPVALTLLLAVPAGAAPGVGKVTVSNPAPTRSSTIEVDSTGWRAGSVVSITLSGTSDLLGRAQADASGAVRKRIAIPTSAPAGFGVLSVNGSTPAGVPQEIVTGLSVVGGRHAPAPARPWVAVSLLMALATLLLLASVRAASPGGADGQLSVAN